MGIFPSSERGYRPGAGCMTGAADESTHQVTMVRTRRKMALHVAALRYTQ